MVWVLLLRWGLLADWGELIWVSPVIPWLLVAGTIFVSLWLQVRLRPLLFDPVDGARGRGEL
jgi:hypothetical protein